MGYENVKKDVFVDEHERSDVVEDREKFLNTIKDLELYLVEFEENKSMKTKNYLDDCTVREDVHYPVIVITYNKCTFSINNGI